MYFSLIPFSFGAMGARRFAERARARRAWRRSSEAAGYQASQRTGVRAVWRPCGREGRACIRIAVPSRGGARDILDGGDTDALRSVRGPRLHMTEHRPTPSLSPGPGREHRSQQADQPAPGQYPARTCELPVLRLDRRSVRRAEALGHGRIPPRHWHKHGLYSSAYRDHWKPALVGRSPPISTILTWLIPC